MYFCDFFDFRASLFQWVGLLKLRAAIKYPQLQKPRVRGAQRYSRPDLNHSRLINFHAYRMPGITDVAQPPHLFLFSTQSVNGLGMPLPSA